MVTTGECLKDYGVKIRGNGQRRSPDEVKALIVAETLKPGGKATLTAIANGHPRSRIDDLLPWNFKQSS